MALRTIGSVHRTLLRGEKRPAEGEESVGDGTQGAVVMEASPCSTLEVIEAELALELLIVALDAPAQLREPHQRRDGSRRRQRGKPLLVGRLGITGLLTEQPLFSTWRRSFLVPVRRPYAYGCKPPALPTSRPFAPFHDAESQGRDEQLEGDWRVLIVAMARSRTSCHAAWFGRDPWVAPRWPDDRLAIDSNHVMQIPLRERLTKLGGVAVAGICKDNVTTYPSSKRSVELRQRERTFRRRRDVVGHASASTPLPICRPGLGQKQPVTDHPATLLTGEVEANRDLTVVDSTERSRVLALHAHGVIALLRKAGVVDHERLDTWQLLVELLRQTRQHLLVRPSRDHDRLLEALSHGFDFINSIDQASSHWSDRLSVAIEEQPRHVPTQSIATFWATKTIDEVIQVLAEFTVELCDFSWCHREGRSQRDRGRKM